MNEEIGKLKELIRVTSHLNEIRDLDILLELIIFEARRVANADAGSIYIREGDSLIFSHVQNDTLQKKLAPGQKLIYSTFRVKISPWSIAGFVASSGQILNIPDVCRIPEDAPYRFDSGYDRVSGYKTTSMLTVPLKTDRNDIVGVLQIINAKDDEGRVLPFNAADEPFVLHFGRLVTMVLQRAQMTRALLLRMISLAELRDPMETGPHVNRVASYAVEIYERWAERRNISRSEIDRNRDILRMAAMLHDVGKVAISDLILRKPARFTEEEYDVMKSHTYLGARLFRDRHSELDEITALVALTHHENWDGSGYPGDVDVETGLPQRTDSNGRAVGRKGEEIPIFGRVTALADVYDALSSKRVYKDAWDENSVLQEIRNLSGKKFDPELVEVFFERLDSIRSMRQRYPEAQ